MRLRTARSTFAAAAAASVLLMTAACGSDEPADDPSSSQSEPADDASDAADDVERTYADGDYEANGTYANPGGQSSVNVELTLEGNVVTALTVTPEASGTSRQYQDQFVSGIDDEVVGKSIDDLDVSKVSGSSLTSQGFNIALDEIKAEAEA